MRLAYLLLLDLDSGRAHVVQTVHTAAALARRGHEVHLHPRIPSGRNAVEILRESLGVDPPPGLHLHPVVAPRDDLARARLLLRWIPDLLSRDPSVVLYARERRALMPLLHLRRWLRAPLPLIYEFHNLEHRTRAGASRRRLRRIRAQEERIAREADGLIATTEALAADLREAFAPGCPVAVVPSGAPVDSLLGSGDPDLTGVVDMVYAGSLYLDKGVDILVRAVALLPDRVRLTVVGGGASGDLARLRSLALQLGLGTRVRFTGPVAATQVPGKLAGADLIAIPAGESVHSRRYTSPLKLFEAMATGVPLVVGPSPAFLEVVEDGRTGLVARDGSPGALAEAVESALEGPGRAREIGRNAMSEAGRYSWESRARRIEAFLEETVSPRRRRPPPGYP